MIKTLTFLLLTFIFFQLNAGTSVFGIAPNSLGTVNANKSTAALGRGGIEAAYLDTLSLNYVNFAQWPFLTQSTISLNLAYTRLSSETDMQSTSSYSGTFDGGYLAIPVMQKKLAFGIGLIPLISNDQSISASNIGVSTNVIETLKSTGNISEGSFIAAYAINENISLAGALSYNFGLIEDIITIDYDAQGYADIELINNYKVFGTSYSLYSFAKFTGNFYSGIKLTFPAQLTLRTEQESRNSTEYVTEERELSLPLKTTFGFTYKFDNQYVIGADLDYQSWKNGYKIDGNKQDNFNNSFRISIGMEKMPSGRRFVPYTQKMYYRAGLYLGQLNVQSNKKYVLEYGITAGIGLPILSPSDRIDITLLYGKRGNISDNLASENIFRLNVSITAGSLWFVREEN